MADKLAKADVDYGEGKPDSHCGICRHFVAPDSCRIVVGEIEPDMWCRQFLAKPKSRREALYGSR